MIIFATTIAAPTNARIELAGSAENVVMTRTFSKIYGLAGLRIGWGYGPAHVIDALKSGLYGMQAQKGEFVLFRRGLKEDTAAPFLRQLGA